jgi:hypothetical protein
MSSRNLGDNNKSVENDDTETTRRIARTGVICMALEKALEDILEESRATTTFIASPQDSHKTDNDNDDHDNDTKHFNKQLSQSSIQPILDAYVTSVVNTNWNKAPKGKWKGRLDHYNRYQDKWRIVVDPISNLSERRQQSITRMQSQKSIASSSNLTTTTTTTSTTDKEWEEPPMEITEKVQFLIYKDL